MGNDGRVRVGGERRGGWIGEGKGREGKGRGRRWRGIVVEGEGIRGLAV